MNEIEKILDGLFAVWDETSDVLPGTTENKTMGVGFTIIGREEAAQKISDLINKRIKEVRAKDERWFKQSQLVLIEKIKASLPNRKTDISGYHIELEEILRHLYATAVQDADGVTAGKKTYRMRYDEVPKIVAKQISDLIKQARIDELERLDLNTGQVEKIISRIAELNNYKEEGK